MNAGRHALDSTDGGSTTRERRLDAGVCAGILSLTIAYTALWPRDFVGFDEGLFLYEAKRILDGDVIYRDFFEIITPASLYVMAFLFELFGTDMVTARTAMAVLHGLIAVAMYAICRESKIRRPIAVVAALAHAAVCYPALSIASPHWMGTFVTLLALWIALRHPLTSARRSLLFGAALGLLVSVQQQKGAVLAVGGALVVVADGFLLAAAGTAARATIAALLAYAAGALAIVLPLVIALLWFAGFGPVYAALIHFPFVYYPQFHTEITWGYYVSFVPQLYVYPRLIKYLPAAVPLAVPRLVHRWWRGETRELRPLLVLTLLAAFTILSVAYNANYTHLAITAPVWLLVVAETLESAWRALERRSPVFRPFGAVVCIALLLILGLRLQQNRDARRELFRYSHDTAFGRVDAMSVDEMAVVEALRGLLRDSPSKEMFCLPNCAGLYLLAGGTNPTPYQLLLQNYSAPEHWTRTIEILERRQVPFVVLVRLFIRVRSDPVAQYVAEHYERVKVPSARPFSPYFLYRRKNG
jgi:hypothetical protein